MTSIFSSPSVLAVNCRTMLKPMQSRKADLHTHLQITGRQEVQGAHRM